MSATALSNLDTMYFSGKALAKFAYICLSTSLVLKDAALARTGLAKLKVCSNSPHSIHRNFLTDCIVHNKECILALFIKRATKRSGLRNPVARHHLGCVVQNRQSQRRLWERLLQ